MEPVQPSPSVDAQPSATPRPDTQASTGGRFSRVTGVASRVLGLDQQAATQTPGATPSFEPITSPGVQPAGNPNIEGSASAPASPWANPDAAAIATSTAGVAPDTAPQAGVEPAPAAPVLPEDPFAPKLATEPESGSGVVPSLASVPEPTFKPVSSAAVEPLRTAPALPEDPFAQKTTTSGVEPISAPTPAPEPEPTTEPIVDSTATQSEPIAVSPVWTPDATLPDDTTATPVGDATVIDPDMRPSSAPSVEPTATTALPEDTTPTPAETPDEPPLFTKTVDGDLIKYVLTPEGRAKIQGAFTKAIEEGLLDNMFGPLMDGKESAQKEALASAANTQGTPEPAPLNPTPIDTSANSTVIPTTPTPAAVDWSNPGGPGPTSS